MARLLIGFALGVAAAVALLLFTPPGTPWVTFAC